VLAKRDPSEEKIASPQGTVQTQKLV